MLLFTLISLLLFAFYGGLIEYYRRAWNAIPNYSSETRLPDEIKPRTGASGDPALSSGSSGSPVKISVLVPARNEEANIGACLASLSRQTYPREQFEVIVIDDHSTDRTASIVQEFAQHGAPGSYPAGPGNSKLTVNYLRLADYTSGTGPVKAHKKFAIETAIGKAAGELIVTTDADCQFSPDWLQTIASFHSTTGAKFIAAPVKIEPGRQDTGHSNALLTIFQTLDFITLQGITGAAVYKGFHSMCNGANLSYEKKAFYEVDGFRGIDAIPSGDDMLLMHKIYIRYPEQVFFLKHAQAVVSTQAETRWRGFVNQRIRWASKADQYDDRRIFWVLLMVYILNALLLGLAVASFWNRWYLWLLLLLLVIKTTVEYPFVRSVALFFRQQYLMSYFPLLQPLHVLYTVVIGWLGKFGSYRWKDRKINK